MDRHCAYCAGFFDGEGCIVIGKNGSLQLRIINTGRPSLQYFQNVLGVGTIKERKQIVNKKQYYWSAYGEDAVKVLIILLPYLIEKEDQARVALKWMQERNDYPATQFEGRGRKAHPLRQERIEYYRTILTQQKLGTYIA